MNDTKKHIILGYNFWSVVLVLLLLASLAVFFIDRPAFVFINTYLHHNGYKTDNLHGRGIFSFIASGRVLLGGAVLFLISVFSITQQNKSLFLRLAFLLYQIASLLLLHEVKLFLKYVFARCSPEVCIYAFANYQTTYGFYWFTEGLKGFPSGHFMVVTYCLIWSFVLKNNVKLFEKLFVGILFYGLVVYNFHFIGDCFAGMLVGALYATTSVLVWRFVSTLNLQVLQR